MFARIMLITLTFLVVGCSSSGPALYPVKGTITRRGEAVEKGSVRFMPVDGQDLIVTGDVDAKGEFALVTLTNSRKRQGAPAGTYTITYMAPTAEISAITINEKYTVEAKPNVFTVELARKKKK